MVDAICLMLRDYYYKYSPFVFPLFAKVKVEVDEQLEFTTRPTNGRSESIEMDVRVDPRIEFQVNGVARLLVPSMRLCRCFKTLCMACHLLISNVPTLFCFAKPCYLIPPHLMSLFSTFAMIPTTFLSRFPLRSLIMGSPTYMENKQPSTLH